MRGLRLVILLAKWSQPSGATKKKGQLTPLLSTSQWVSLALLWLLKLLQLQLSHSRRQSGPQRQSIAGSHGRGSHGSCRNLCRTVGLSDCRTPAYDSMTQYDTV